GGREAVEAVEQRVEPHRDDEALIGELDRGLEQLGPGQLAVLAMRKLEHPEHARHADRETADADLRERRGSAVVGEEHVRRRGRGRGLAALVPDERGPSAPAPRDVLQIIPPAARAPTPPLDYTH